MARVSDLSSRVAELEGALEQLLDDLAEAVADARAVLNDEEGDGDD